MIGPAAMNSATAAGKVKQQRGFERAVLGFHGRGVIVVAETAAELRQQHDADGDADDAERKLKQAVGVIEPGHHAILKRGNHGVEDDGDLAHAAGDECRRGERQQPAHIGVELWRPHREAHLGTAPRRTRRR